MNTGLCFDAEGRPVDGVAAPVLADVLERILALYDELPGVDGPCAAGLMSGAAAAIDRGLDEASGCCGQLWLRLVDVFPSTTFPEPEVGPHRDSDSLSWAVVLEIGLVRPAPMLRDSAEGVLLPTMEEETAAADRVLVDLAVLREALLVRYADAEDVAVVVGSWAPIGPDGGIVGGALTATIQIV